MNAINRQDVIEDKDNALIPLDDPHLGRFAISNAITHCNPTTQMLLTTKPLVHRKEAGLNPLVDAAAYLFSIMGKLKHVKSYDNLDALHAELVQEIENFQATVETQHYHDDHLSEYIPISCYALCMTLDDIIFNTPWGSQGKWDELSLVKSFSDQPLSNDNFLILLERLVRDPAIYIDVMEFLYICLSLGLDFRYQQSTSGFTRDQLEQILHSLYKRIRVERGGFNKTLAPYSIKPFVRHRQIKWNNTKIASITFIAVISLLVIGVLVKSYKKSHAYSPVTQQTRMEMTHYEKLHDLS